MLALLVPRACLFCLPRPRCARFIPSWLFPLPKIDIRRCVQGHLDGGCSELAGLLRDTCPDADDEEGESPAQSTKQQELDALVQNCRHPSTCISDCMLCKERRNPDVAKINNIRAVLNAGPR